MTAMHDNIPASVDPDWVLSKTIWIRRVPRQMKLNKGERTRRTKMVQPSVCKAHRGADRRGLMHIRESGSRQSATKKEAHGFDASRGIQVGMSLNPTGITLCGLQGGEHVPGEFDRLVQRDGWCPECVKALRSWLTVKAVKAKLG